MAKVLNGSVHVYDEDGSFKVLLAGNKVPKEYKSQVGDHLLSDTAEAEDEATTTAATIPVVPPTAPTPPAKAESTTSSTEVTGDAAKAVDDGRPPRAGAGSTGAAWLAYAKDILKLEVADDANKGQILDLVDAHDAAQAKGQE